MNVLGIIASGAAALFITVVLAKGVRRTALRAGAAHEPGARPSRAGVVRRLGGTTVVLGVGAAAAAGTGLGAAGGSGRAVTGLLAGAATVAALGLVHDVRPLGTPLRAAVQTAAATLAVCLAGLSPVAGVLAVIGIVAVTQAFALLDTSDGTLATVGTVTAAGLLTCAVLDGRAGLALPPAVLLAGLIGFLLHNWHPARIRPGACGSLFTGFVLASSGALILAEAPPERAAWAALPVLATVALADAALVLVSRRRAARPLLQDCGDHITHRLRRLRVTVPGVAVVLGLWAGVATLTGTLVYAQVLHPAFVLVPVAGSAAAVVALLRVPAYVAPPVTATRRRPPTGTAATGTSLRPGPKPVPAVPESPAPTPPGQARTTPGRPTVPPPPTGRPAVGLTADRS
ncbi:MULTISPECIES: MraY family glycosyltransferase [Streptomyces]|uniref:MraY family glycosyltransferase n=1 Tax=Streptomyces TaxID=1883 RepID=UPI0010387E81|nr:MULTISPECIES: MraY family glycosyltransferase [Streptomyces]MBT3074788.1 undecaprenyl/decaprenyl-phosphate alpha-N-acetylglucosaminyl 1-phosphate transferase [Streptomyces sp. COG21]MBT3081842.1 undecaprenyl/decaprenyl-phosphate alpha-N-acetylglucosaminyl 1-phosphate transferase [Streptomyces sp. COG20]MBT3090638.1 undecaprenyl/decaprenyl-phosphate alpha-N-acetylglucosaminyl 1-phosphate transferase [Streptomyces sp. CYG21]MBT3098107.1 undecaprenyl/decaprenyl-phosphate alpha-N-acetylglucosami